MIIQILLDFLSMIVGNALDDLPSFPLVVIEAADTFASLMDQATDILAPLGRIIPWIWIMQLVGFYAVMLVFWAGSIAVRFVLWLLGR